MSRRSFGADAELERSLTSAHTMMAEVRRNVPWTLLSYVANRVITLAVTIVLAHLLTPADFGLVALALTIMTIFNIASGLGLANVIVTERNLDKRASGTLLTLTVVSGAIVAALLVAVAPAMGQIFQRAPPRRRLGRRRGDRFHHVILLVL